MRPAAVELSDLDTLEAESIFIIREVAAEFEHPVMLFSGGKDSVLMLHLARKAFAPAPVPFPIMHIDTGHNFPEVIEFRDRQIAEYGLRLEVASVQDLIDTGQIKVGHELESRNRHQTVALLEGSRTGASTRSSAAAAATRTRRGRRSGCSPSATASASGTRRTSARSSGASTTAATARASTSASSRSPTGPSSTSGATWRASRSTCRRSTSPTSARWSRSRAC